MPTFEQMARAAIGEETYRQICEDLGISPPPLEEEESDDSDLYEIAMAELLT